MQQPSSLSPGLWVRHPGRPDWGVGQVQSAVADRVTVNFEHAGKVLVDAGVVQLEPLDDPPDTDPCARPA
jgi:hypothetical protein